MRLAPLIAEHSAPSLTGRGGGKSPITTMKESTKKSLKRIVEIVVTILTALITSLTTTSCMGHGPFAM